MDVVVSVVVNGKDTPVPDGASVRDVLAGLGIDPGRGGVAVAVDDAVVPAGRWSAVRLTGGERLEVLGAVAGG